MKRILILATAAMVSAFTAHVCAEDVGKTEKKAEKAKPVFKVFAGNCSRSLKLEGAYNDASMACWAADRLKGQNSLIIIRTGVEPLHAFGPVDEYRVYHCPCKTYLLDGTFTHPDDARKWAKGRELEGGSTWVVSVTRPEK